MGTASRRAAGRRPPRACVVIVHVRRRVCAGWWGGGESGRGEEGRGGTGGGGGADAAHRGGAGRRPAGMCGSPRAAPTRGRRAASGRRRSHATQVSTKPSPIWSSSRNEPSDWSTEPAVTLPAHDEHAPARHEYGRSRPSSSACERVIAGVRGRSRIRPRGLVPSGNSPRRGAMRTLSRMYVSSGQSIFDSPSGVFSVTVMCARGAEWRGSPRRRTERRSTRDRRWRGGRRRGPRTKQKRRRWSRSPEGGVREGDMKYGTRAGPPHGRSRATALYGILGAARSTTGLGGHTPHTRVVAVLAELLPGASGSRSPGEKRSYFPRPLLRAGVGALPAFARLA